MTIRYIIERLSQIEIGSLELTEDGRLLGLRQERELVLDRGRSLDRGRRRQRLRRRQRVERLLVDRDGGGFLGGGLRFGGDRFRPGPRPGCRPIRAVEQ